MWRTARKGPAFSCGLPPPNRFGQYVAALFASGMSAGHGGYLVLASVRLERLVLALKPFGLVG